MRIPIYIVTVNNKKTYVGIFKSEAMGELVLGKSGERLMEIYLESDCVFSKKYTVDEIEMIKEERYNENLCSN